MVLIIGSDGNKKKMTMAEFSARGFIPGKEVARIPMQRNLPAGQLGFMDRYTKAFNACGGGKGILCKKNWYTKFGPGTEDAVEQHVRDAANRKFVELVTVTSGQKELTGIIFLVDPKTLGEVTTSTKLTITAGKKKTAEVTKKASVATKAPKKVTASKEPAAKKIKDLPPPKEIAARTVVPTGSVIVTDEWLATASRAELETKRAEADSKLGAAQATVLSCNEDIRKINAALTTYDTREADERAAMAKDVVANMSPKAAEELMDALVARNSHQGVLGGQGKPKEEAKPS